jgi:ubiquitin C-terminal hydrolase
MRWQDYRSKNTSHITAPLQLDMAAFAAPATMSGSSSSSSSSSLYDLVGVVHHRGTNPSGGHYFAEVRRPDGRWYMCNDSSISTVSRPSVAGPCGSETAYVLLYQQRQAPVLRAPVQKEWWSAP